MATRNFVPRADDEGGIGTALKRWATAKIVEITSDRVVLSDGAGNYMQLPKLTTAERDALTPVNGMVIYNSTATMVQMYQGGVWGSVGAVVASGITTSLINTSAVTTAKIAASAITTTLINTSAVTTAKIAASAITTTLINTSAVTTGKIAASTITTTLINATAVTAAKIAPDAITTTKIAASAVELSSQVVGELPASRVGFLKIGDPTYDNAQDWMNIVQSASVIDGFELSTSRLSYQLDVAAGSGLIKITDSPIGVTKPFDIGTTENVTLTDNSMNYIYIDYNGGTPIIAATNTRSNIELNRHCIIGRCYKEGSGGSAVIDHLNSEVCACNIARTIHERLVDVHGFEHASGAAVSETGALKFAVTAGRWYIGNHLVTTDALDTNVADTFIYTHYGAASWIEDNATATTFDYTHYNQGADALGNITVNKYGVHWVYILQDSKLYVIYGAGDYLLTEADGAQPPTSIPSIINGMGELLAKVIIKQDGTLISIESAFDLALSLSGTVVHNESAGLQGGIAGEYYHFTSAQADMLTSSGITTTLINTSAVTTAKIAASAITTTLINSTAVTAAKIAPSAVTTTKIAASAVTTAKINTSAVTTAKIAASAITTTLINANAITITKIADGTDGELITWDSDGYAAVVAVGTAGHVLTSSGVGKPPTFKASTGGVAASGITTTLINTSAVTTAKIAASAITTTLINTSAVTTGKIAASAITTTLINATAVTAAKIAPNAVTTTKINTSAVTTAKIAASAITTTLINNGAVTNTKIGSSAITAAKISNGAIGSNQIAVSAVNDAKIDSSTITARSLTTSAVTTPKIAASAVTTAKINTSAVTTGKIAASAITTTLINATAVTAAKIAPNAVTTTKINTSAVTTAKIAASAITTTLINANAITITKIADGTDGELITWDSDGYAAVVAVGTAGHVLTSSGVGKPPTFKASNGGVAASGITTTLINTSAVTTAKIAASAITTTLVNTGAITATKIASGVLTEKIWFPAESAYLPVTNPAELTEELGATVYAGQSHLDFDDATAEHAVFRGPVIDYDGGNITITATAKVASTPAGAVTLVFDIYTIGIATSEAYDAAVTADTGVDITFNLTASDLLTDLVIATATIDPANVADGDKLVIEFIRNVSDTLVGDGELVDFTAEYNKA